MDTRVPGPRSDTKTLVDWALALIPEPAPCRVLGLGTGSGAIARGPAHAEISQLAIHDV